MSSLRAQTPNSAQLQELVLANHILENEGILDAYGHVSVRDERNPNRFLLSRSLPPSVVTAPDILEYDLDSNPVRDTKAAGYSERFIHGEIYKSRADVMAVIHSHAPEILPFTVTNVPLRPMIHMAGFLPPRVPIFDIRKAAGITNMLIGTSELGHALAGALGDSPIVLLRGHGAAVVGPSLHMTVGRAVYMTLNAKAQLRAIMIGGGQVAYMEPDEAQKASQNDYERGWAYWKSKVESRK